MGFFRRKKYFIKKSFQLKYAMMMIISLIIAVAVLVWSVYAEVGHMIVQTGDPGYMEIMYAFNSLLIKQIPLLMLFVILMGIFISHEIAGPICHLEKSAQRVKDGDLTERIALRKGDELKEIGIAFNTITEGISKLIAQDRDDTIDIEQDLRHIASGLDSENISDEELKNIKKKIDEILPRIKGITRRFNI